MKPGITPILLAFVAEAAVAQPYPDHPHTWGGWWGMFLGPLMMIVFLTAIIVVAVLIVRWISGSGATSPPPLTHDKALAILKERFARGEIDKEEFEERKRLLSDSYKPVGLGDTRS